MYTLPAASIQGTGSTVVPVGVPGGRVAVGVVVDGVPVAVDVDVPATVGGDATVDAIGVSVGVPEIVPLVPVGTVPLVPVGTVPLVPVGAVPVVPVGSVPVVPVGVAAPHSATGEATVGGDVSACAAAGSAMARTPIAVATAVHLDPAVIGFSFRAAGSPTPHQWSCHCTARPRRACWNWIWQSQTQRPAAYDGPGRPRPSRLFT